MKISGQAVLLRVFVGESDKLGHLPLYEVIVRRARDADLAGATVLKGVLGFGASARIRTQKILDLSSDLPMVIEIVDEMDKITAFQDTLSELFEGAGRGGLVTLENIRIVHYLPGKKT
jgi:PII-like signaling protein